MFIRALLIGAALAVLSSRAAGAGFDHQHAAWTALLRKHVVLIDGGNASQVRYAQLAKDRTALNDYLATLSKVTHAEFSAWTRPQQAAFLINAYNGFTVEKILTRYPDIRSIWDFGKIFGNPFKDDFFSLFGEKFTLDRIEHETLRKPGVYNEHRVHYAVNCASVGCPMLREEAYVADRLEQQLEQQTVRFLSDRSRNRANAQGGELEVSKIYDWFKDDWTRGYRGISGKGEPVNLLEQFFAKYAVLLADDPAQQDLIRSGKAKIRFLDYDWSLNDARAAGSKP